MIRKYLKNYRGKNKLIALDTVNPPGNESEAAKLVGNLLEENGFKVASHNPSKGGGR